MSSADGGGTNEAADRPATEPSKGRWKWAVLGLIGAVVVLGAGGFAATTLLSPSDSEPVDFQPTRELRVDESATPAALENLAMITNASVRNSNHDDSAARDTPQDDLNLEDHYGPRTDYLAAPGGNPERSFPVGQGGQFRASCEFSHFAYDDPLIFPNQPGASHLHMFFGNTDVHAYSSHDSLINSGSSTCNGQELNRTGYWVPAMFDGDGNVRIPERIMVYYKGENVARGISEVYPPGAAMIASKNLNTTPSEQGGAAGAFKLTYLCTDNYSTPSTEGGHTMPICDGSLYGGDPGLSSVLEMNVKFPTCWNGKDPADWDNFGPSTTDWYANICKGSGFEQTLPNLEYFVNYRVEDGETTEDWFLSSDVDHGHFGRTQNEAGSSVHGDWWGGWHPEVNKMWIDNCVNYITDDRTPSGCGTGYLTDGGPNGADPLEGPALSLRPQYEGPFTVPAETLFNELCPNTDRKFNDPEDAAFCNPAETK